MEMPPAEQVAEYEQTLIRIVRTLPAERAAQVVDYARFIQSQTLPDLLLEEDASAEVIQADEEHWDTQFAGSSGKLRRLAQEAREDIETGRTKEMILTANERIIPG